ncbi:MAG: GDSL-type esterase/lipase family protein [Planctomycetota bacterium]
MTRVLPLVVVLALATCNALIAQNPRQLSREVSAWVEQDQTDPPPKGSIVFVGSSTIRRWESLARQFDGYTVVQRGFGGSTFADILPVVDQIVTPYAPAGVVVFAGTNDLAKGRTAAQVVEDFEAFIRQLRAADADEEVFFLAITPAPSRRDQWPAAAEVNRAVRQLAADDPHLHFVDIASPLLVDDAPPAAGTSNDFVDDQLHLSPAGYAKLETALRSVLPRVIEPRVIADEAAVLVPGETIRIDFGTAASRTKLKDGARWNHWHDAEPGTKILAGQRLSSVVTSEGRRVSIAVVITGGVIAREFDEPAEQGEAGRPHDLPACFARQEDGLPRPARLARQTRARSRRR